jgi:16S rRNA (guanine1207-N2)-methyltransferase
MTTNNTGSTDPAIVLLIELLAEQAALSQNSRVLILNGQDPALALAAAKTAAQVAVYSDSAGALARTESPLKGQQVDNVSLTEVAFPDDSQIGAFDVVLLPLPKGRDYTRGLLWTARLMLAPGGKLYMTGANDSGIKTLFSDAALLFGATATLIIRHRCRVGVATQPRGTAPVYPASWGADPMQPQQRTIAGLTLSTLPGVFSWQALDDGTAFLLDHLTITPGERVLDVGCGYGVIGLTAAVRGAGQVTLTDDSLLATHCTRESIKNNRARFGTAQVDVVIGDLFTGIGDQKFNLIVSNPPFHQQFETDMQVTRRLIREAVAHLLPGGRLLIVANVFLRYDKLMRDSFGNENVRTVAETPRYAVWEATK